MRAETEFNVFSCFDGISCGQQALVNAGVKYDKYYASEIDQRAIAVTQRRWPKTIQFGSITKIKAEHFMSPIHLLMGGSPCQGFSFAGKRLNFDDPRSKLFFEFDRVRKQLNPEYFFLENVKMDKDSENIISEYLGVEPVLFNSAVVSPQNRERLYWTNIKGFTMPMDRRMVINDILDTGFRKTHDFVSNGKAYDDTSYNRCLQVGFDYSTTFEQRQRIYSKNAKCPTIDTARGGKRTIKIAHTHEKFIELNINELGRLQGLPDGYAGNVSKSAAAHGIGNGWQVDTIVEFFKHLPTLF